MRYVTLYFPGFERKRSGGSVAARLAALLVTIAASGLVSTVVAAQSPLGSASSSARQSGEDPRWLPWLGCWQTDTTGAQGIADARVTCVIPAPGVSAVDMVSIAGGRVVGRERFDASGRPRAIDQAGCKGLETAEWSPERVRVYVRSDYSCGGVSASSTRLLSIAPSGEWIDAEAVNAGGGTITHMIRRRDVGLPAGVPADVSRALDRRQLAIAAARAAAAAPLTTSDVVEAVRQVDASVVRNWIIASGTRFALSGAQASALVQANVPPTVLQAMMGDTRSEQQRAAEEASGAADEYLRGSSATTLVLPGEGYAPSQAYGYACPPPGYCAPNPYSPYNGYSYYPYDGSAFGYSPFANPYATYLPIIITNGFRNGHGEFHGRGPVGVHPNGGKPFVGRPIGPTGARPGGGGRRP